MATAAALLIGLAALSFVVALVTWGDWEFFLAWAMVALVGAAFCGLVALGQRDAADAERSTRGEAEAPIPRPDDLCPQGRLTAAFGTPSFATWVCERDGSFTYTGVRQRDGASITLSAVATGTGGFEARNGDTTYFVDPEVLRVTQGGVVLVEEPVL